MKAVRKNGMDAENYALSWLREQYPEVEFKLVDDIFDIRGGDKIIEVKSCLKYVKDDGRQRAGRFVLKGEQHDYLLENEGKYLFVILENGQPFDTFLYPAKFIHPLEGDYRHIAWTTIYPNRGYSL